MGPFHGAAAKVTALVGRAAPPGAPTRSRMRPGLLPPRVKQRPFEPRPPLARRCGRGAAWRRRRGSDRPAARKVIPIPKSMSQRSLRRRRWGRVVGARARARARVTALSRSRNLFLEGNHSAANASRSSPDPAIEPMFPLWGLRTGAMGGREMIARRGLRAYLPPPPPTWRDPKQAPRRVGGQELRPSAW